MNDIEAILPLINTLVTRDYNRMGSSNGFGRKITLMDGGKLYRIVVEDTLDGKVRNGGRSAFGFIVKEDNSVKSATTGQYFKRGDILKTASWKAPAKNFARGNVFNLTDASVIPWTGVSNLKE
jgi:hypothetical protein